MKHSNKETLADKIAGVLNTTPASFDPEDDSVDDTRAKLIENYSEHHDDDEELLSSFRRQNIELLSDVDKRYVGKKATRKSLQDFDEDVSENDQFEQQNVESSESENEDDENEDQNSELIDSSEEIEEENESEVEESDEYGSSNDNFAGESITENTENFKHFKENDGLSQIKKGLCVRNQMNMWENLLEIRIQLQKCLISANKMPQKDKYIEIKKESSQEFSDQVSVTKNSLIHLLDKLMLLQKLSLNKYPETKKLHKSNEKDIKENDNEEIASDTENEVSSDEEDNESVPKKKRKLNDFEKDINERHKCYKNYRNSVIQKWNDKTRIATLKNSTSSHSVLNHIEHTLSDRTKLVKRTRLKRSDYTITGQEPLTDNASKEEKTDVLVEEYNTEIFDDDDFYHQLLRELIEVKSADLTDPIQLGRQWIQLQKLRSKMKRKIDTRATKGRKIRYTVHTKLVNFMAPIDEYLWTDQAKTELFSSLFGKKELIRNS